MVDAAQVKKLRDSTGAGMMDCKRALEEAGGDTEKATEYLREKGLAKAAKKASRIANQGLVESYIHSNGKIGVLLEVNCETDFVARNEEFKALCHDIAMQIAASHPQYVSREEVPEDVIEKEKAILRAQAENEGKPEHIIEKMVEGRMDKYYQEICLLEQAFIKDTDKYVHDIIKDSVAKLGEKIEVRRFTRYELGEGLEEKKDDFVEEVKKMAGK